MDKLDYKKEYRDLYLPGKKPSLVMVPSMLFIMADGTGAPEGASYQEVVSILYSLSFTIKMSKMGPQKPEGYFEYTVPPLEGLWTLNGEWFDPDRESWQWCSMIRQPEFVTPEVFAWAVGEAGRKKPELDFSRARLEVFEEGACAQIMHTGPYAEEDKSIALLKEFICAQGYQDECSDDRRHHEIYLSDPRRSAPERLKTVLRHPVGKLPAEG